MRNDRYIVAKIGEYEGPHETSTSADHMKPWLCPDDAGELESEEDAQEENF